MNLRGIDFGNVLGASGVQGFFGEGYWFHQLPLIGPDFRGMTFVSKTATLNARQGNIKRKRGIFEWILPSWARINFFGDTLNSMGLPNPGINNLLAQERWQKMKTPFLISLASVEATKQKRIDEIEAMIDAIAEFKEEFQSPFGLQINLSCPNTGHNPRELIGESAEVLSFVAKLNVALMPKYSIASAPIEAIMELNDNPNCDAICVSNTVPFDWQGIGQKIWGRKVSPLSKIGSGGISGKVLLPLVCNWIKRLRGAGFEKPINGGGGIFCKEDVKQYRDAGANSCFLGTVAIHHPWRVKGIISYANNLEWR